MTGRWSLPVAAALVGAVAILAITLSPAERASAGASTEPLLPARTEAAGSPPAAPAPAPPVVAADVVAEVDTELPEEGRVYVPGQGHATVVPSDPAHAPEPERQHPDPVVNPPVPEEQPQTAEWRADKLHQAVQLAELGVERAERQLSQARASGDPDQVRLAETALNRRRAGLEQRRAEEAAARALATSGSP